MTVAIIRAAGRGERMGEISRYYQKCALPIDGKPLIIHWLDAIWEMRNPIHIEVVCGYHAIQIQHMVSQWTLIEERKLLKRNETWQANYPVTKLTSIDNPIWRDTLQLFDSPWMKKQNMLLCYADNYSPQIKKVVNGMLLNAEWIKEDAADAVIGMIPNLQCSKATEEVIWEYQTGKILAYRTGLREANPLSYSWAGIGIFSPKTFEMVYDTPHEVFQRLAEEGRLLGWIIPDRYEYRDIGSMDVKF